MSSVGVEVPPDAGRQWVEGSLLEGSRLAAVSVLGVLSEKPSFWLLGVQRADAEALSSFEYGLGVDGAVVEVAVSRVLGVLAAQGGRLLLVEDDAGRRGDPVRNGPVAYVGNRVLRWCSLEQRGRAFELLRASAYPLNAFVVSADESSLGLESGCDLCESGSDLVARSLIGVIVAALDAETYVVAVSGSLDEGVGLRSSGELDR